MSAFAGEDAGESSNSADASLLEVLKDLRRDDTEAAGRVRALLDAGASPNASLPLDDDPTARIPALYFACVVNHVEVARLLLERGANPNDGESVYHAAERNHRECLELLEAHGADLSARHTQYGNTPLYFLAGYREGHELCESSTLGMHWLLEHGADPNVLSYAQTTDEHTPGIAETPLHRTAENGRGADLAQLLIAHGAHVDAQRGDGKTAYTIAMRTGNFAMADALVSAGADATNLSPTDQLLAACARADGERARALLAQYDGLLASLTTEDRNTIVGAVHDDRVESVRLMVSLGWSLTEEGPWGGTPLHWAAWFGRVRAVRTLLDLDAPINFRDRQYGSSPIAWAAHGSRYSRPGNDDDYLAIVDLLLDAGSSRAASFNHWSERPESLASVAVAERLIARGFSTEAP